MPRAEGVLTMKGLILFRSHYGNTRLVAEAIAKKVQELGHEAVLQDLRDKLPEMTGIDFVMIGAPTRFARVTGKALSQLKELRKKGMTRLPIAVFDTYGPVPTDRQKLEKSQKWLYPGAAGIMLRVAEEQGLNVYPKALRCEVREGTKGPLADGQLEKAASFAEEFLARTVSEPK